MGGALRELNERRSSTIAYLSHDNADSTPHLVPSKPRLSHRWWIAFIVLLFALCAGSIAQATINVNEIALDEINRISSQGFVLPTMYVVSRDQYEHSATTFHFEHETKWFVELHAIYYAEAQVRYLAAYETGRILLDESKVLEWSKQADVGEPLARRFAACFGSASSREWAMKVVKVELNDETCEALKSSITLPNRQSSTISQ
jgi:hypothetical protein